MYRTFHEMEDFVENEELEELRDNQFDLPEIGKSKVKQTKSTMSTSSIDSGIGMTLKSHRSSVSSLISDVDTSGCTIADVAWDVERADLVIKVQQTLFPVHRSLVSLYSVVLKNIIFSVHFGDEDTQLVTLMEQNVQTIQDLLTFIYFQDKEITGEKLFLSIALDLFHFIHPITALCKVLVSTELIPQGDSVLQ